MIRFILVAAISSIFCVAFYLPSRVAPEEFLQVMSDEHALVTGLWGEEVADRILLRSVKLKKAPGVASPAPPLPTTSGGALFGQVSERLFGNQYLQAMDSLFTLASFRACCALELLPVLLVFLVTVAIDGSVVRVVRSKELIAQSAERFSASIAAGLLLGVGVVVAWFLPFQLHPMLVLAALLGMLFAMSRALANYHTVR